MSMNGSWVLHYSWGPTSNYAQANITFNADGSFAGPGPADGFSVTVRSC